MKNFLNLASYEFLTILDPWEAKKFCLSELSESGIKGTILLAQEGFNIHLCGEEKNLRAFFQKWGSFIKSVDPRTHISFSEILSFKKLKVVLKKEICTSACFDFDINKDKIPYIQPEELAQKLDKNEELLLFDNRNQFETDIGTFENAIPCGTEAFVDLPKAVDDIELNHSKDKEVVMFCTGGIRCEKAGAYFKSRGFNNVKQLDGGILTYFDKVGEKHFKGNCFVFDERWELDTSCQVKTQIND